MVKSFDFLQNWQFRNSHNMAIFMDFLDVNGRNGNSIKTRIETTINFIINTMLCIVATAIPLKQGLKPNEVDFPDIFGYEVATAIPLKQGLKLLYSSSENRRAPRSQRQFH